MKKFTRIALERHIAQHTTSAKTLDIGSYGGSSYKSYFPNLTGMDIRPGPGVDVVGSVYEMPFPDATFETILCISALEHFEEPQKAVDEMLRILKPGGTALIQVPLLFPVHDAPGDYWRFTSYGLKSLFKRWTVVSIDAENHGLKAVGSLLQRLGFQTTTYGGRLGKIIIYSLAWLFYHAPNLIKKTYGGIERRTEESGAFATTYFMVAQKPE